MSIIIPFTKDANIEISENELRKAYSNVLYTVHEICGYISDEGILMNCTKIKDRKYGSCTLHKGLDGLSWHTHPINGYIDPSTSDVMNVMTSKYRKCSIVFTGIGIFVINCERNYEFIDDVKIREFFNDFGSIIMAKTSLLFHRQFKFLELDKLHKQYINFDSIIDFFEKEYLKILNPFLKRLKLNDVKISFHRYPFSINYMVSFSYFIDSITTSENQSISSENRPRYRENFFPNTFMESYLETIRFFSKEINNIENINYIKKISFKECLHSLTPKYLRLYLDELSESDFLEVIYNSKLWRFLNNDDFRSRDKKSRIDFILEKCKMQTNHCLPIIFACKDDFYNINLFYTTHSTQHFFTTLKSCSDINFKITLDFKYEEKPLPSAPPPVSYNEVALFFLKKRLLNNLLELVDDDKISTMVNTRLKEITNYTELFIFITKQIKKINLYLIEKYSKNLTKEYLKDCYDVCLILKKVVEDSNYECSPSIIYAYRKILMK